uniref:hypothetical protein n=1 Tax=uncultured Allobacillus sp. TaxID=1638025 RepID=UPI002598B208|nr:hypothetical protein [uncultured Allobacillus sp.]
MTQFELMKELPENINHTIGQLEEQVHQVFKHIAYFQERLNAQHGMAATSIKGNLNAHITLMGKSAPILLHFMDVMKYLVSALVSTDEGAPSIQTPISRAEWNYSLSSERIKDEVKLDAESLKEAAISLQNNMTLTDSIFHQFNRVIESMMADTRLPWGDFNSNWHEAKSRMRAITEETNHHIASLVEESNLLVQELERVDHMAAQMKIPF